MLFDDSALTAEAVRSDLFEACIALAAERGIASLSFVFPRDLDGYDHIVRKYGFLPYWGADPTWHARLRRGGAGGAPGRSDCGDHAARFGTAPGAARALDISRSMPLMHRSGIRRLVPLASRAYKAGAAFSVRLDDSRVSTCRPTHSTSPATPVACWRRSTRSCGMRFGCATPGTCGSN